MSDESSNVIVSVIIPVHNAAEYIAETLTTVLAQSLKRLRLSLLTIAQRIIRWILSLK